MIARARQLVPTLGLLALGLAPVIVGASSESPVPARPEAPPPEVTEHRDARPDHAHAAAAPIHDPRAKPVGFDVGLFGPDPSYGSTYEVSEQIAVYGGKTAFRAPRPLIELGYPMYAGGPLGQTYTTLGEKNLLRPQLLLYGDLRTALSWEDDGGSERGQIATRLNLDADLRLTATERLHMLVRPLDDEDTFSRVVLGGDDGDSSEYVANYKAEALFLEGDIGAIHTGLADRYQTYDLPFAVGRIPLVLQNGIWVEDAFDGFAISRVARNSPRFDITNYDVTLFVGFNEVTSNALLDSTVAGTFVGADGRRDDDAGLMVGLTTFMDVQRGYLEAGWGHVHDRDDADGDHGYHSLALAFTRRYFGRVSNSVRLIASVGQDVGDADAGFLARNGAAGFRPRETADGWVLLVENSLVTHLPSTLVPYLNLWVGHDRPQPLARREGLLKNTGINFENDGMGSLPTLDDSAANTFGGAIGIQYLFALDQQIVVEAATVQVTGDRRDRRAPGDQYALGVRWQRNLGDRWIVRGDAMLGALDGADDIRGVRLELRRKF